MTKAFVRVVLAATMAVAGCATQTQILNNKQSIALQTALTRAKFDMNCPTATAEVLSREVTQPAVQSPMLAGEQRAEYTIGVEGCGKRTTMLVLCPEGGDSCFAGEPGGRFFR
ncbi:MAG: hypothetical protein ABW298_17785 [Candidatus Binatia bacterium]